MTDGQFNEFEDTDLNLPGSGKTIRDIMSENVRVVRPDSTIAEAARMMREADIGALPVCDGDRIQGIVTDRDIVINGLAQGIDTEMPVSEVMTVEIEYVFEKDSIEKAAQIMEVRQIRRLIVLDEEKKLRGIISLGDLSQKSGQTLEGFSKSA